MKKSILYFGAIVAMFCSVSCSSDSADSRPIETNDEAAPAADVVPADGDQVDSPEEIASEAEAKRMSESDFKDMIEEKNENNPTKRSVNNTSSIYRYLTSNPDYSVFGALLQSSSLTKGLHHDSYTMFAPLDSEWNQADKKKALGWAKTGETAKVDAYLKNHLIPIIVSAQKLQKTESLNSEGKMVFIFDQENIEVNGIPFSTTDYSVGNGNVISLNGNFPL